MSPLPPPLPVTPVSTPETFTPLADDSRLPLLDSLRGFALFGILLVNISGFKVPRLAMHPVETYFPGTLNLLARDAVEIFANARFLPIFAFVFGLGLVVQQTRAAAVGTPFTPFLIRRMLVMLLFGILHGVFLWHGDILAVYALFGILAAGFIRVRIRTLLMLAASLWVLLALFIAIPLQAFGIDPDDLSMYSGWRENADAWIVIYQSHDLPWITSTRIQEWEQMWLEGIFFAFPYAFTFFLLGIASGKFAMRAGFRATLDSILPRLRKAALPLFITGLACAIIHPAAAAGFIPGLSAHAAVTILAFLCGATLLTFAYLTLALILLHTRRFPRLAENLACVGRMSLTNYLFQSLAANLVFMGWGLGFYGKTPLPAGLAIAVLIFILQLLLSKIWLRRFPTGPMEWLWRKLSYSFPG